MFATLIVSCTHGSAAISNEFFRQSDLGPFQTSCYCLAELEFSGCPREHIEVDVFIRNSEEALNALLEHKD